MSAPFSMPPSTASIAQGLVDDSMSRESSSTLLSFYQWVQRQAHRMFAQHTFRRLSIAERLSLGDKQSVSIVRVDREQFLIAATRDHIVVLAKLEQLATESVPTSVSDRDFRHSIEQAGDSARLWPEPRINITDAIDSVRR